MQGIYFPCLFKWPHRHGYLYLFRSVKLIWSVNISRSVPPVAGLLGQAYTDSGQTYDYNLTETFLDLSSETHAKGPLFHIFRFYLLFDRVCISDAILILTTFMLFIVFLSWLWEKFSKDINHSEIKCWLSLVVDIS